MIFLATKERKKEKTNNLRHSENRIRLFCKHRKLRYSKVIVFFLRDRVCRSNNQRDTENEQRTTIHRARRGEKLADMDRQTDRRTDGHAGTTDRHKSATRRKRRQNEAREPRAFPLVARTNNTKRRKEKKTQSEWIRRHAHTGERADERERAKQHIGFNAMKYYDRRTSDDDCYLARSSAAAMRKEGDGSETRKARLRTIRRLGTTC